MSDKNPKNGKSPQNENSVLMSLKALRIIESERLDAEAEQQRAIEESRQRAQAEAERLARQGAERKHQATIAAARLAEESARRQEQEAQVQLAAASAAARVEAEARLETQRLQLEVARGGRRPARWAMPVALTAALLLLGAGAYVMGVYLPGEQREKDAAAAQRIQADRDALAQQKQATRRLASLKEAMNASADSIAKLKGELADLRQEKAERDALASKGKSKGKGRKGRLVAQAGGKRGKTVKGRRPRGGKHVKGRRPKGPKGGKVKRPNKSCKSNPLCYLFQD